LLRLFGNNVDATFDFVAKTATMLNCIGLDSTIGHPTGDVWVSSTDFDTTILVDVN